MINIYMYRKICKNVINTYYVILSTPNIYIYIIVITNVSTIRVLNDM